MESYTIAVIGSAGAGKSTFIQKVLGLSRPPIASSASVRLVVDNVTHGVSLFELDLENFDQTASSQTIQWPKQINGHIVPRPDAALLLYDVTNKASIRPLPQAMSMLSHTFCSEMYTSSAAADQATAAITNANLPSALVACKCEDDEDDWEVDADGVASHKVFKSCIGTYKVSADKAEVSRACLQIILKAAIAHRKGKYDICLFESLFSLTPPIKNIVRLPLGGERNPQSTWKPQIHRLAALLASKANTVVLVPNYLPSKGLARIPATATEPEHQRTRDRHIELTSLAPITFWT